MPGNGQEFGPCMYCGEFHAEDILMCPRAEKLLPLEGRLLDGKFRFVRRLGEGGMGSVWQCDNILVRRTVAIKLMHIQFSRDEGTLARFRNEATAAGRIGSRHICDILDLGTSSLGPYIVMEMLQGSDLAEYVQRNHPVPAGLVVMVIRQALLGLQAAHEAGIVHRDLKPENIFMHQPEPGRLLVKLMDFGISKFSEGSEAGKTGLGVLMGTPEYMSPEQSEGAAKVDHRTDIWAIGVIIYWALSGRNPFLGQTLAQTLMNVGMREVSPLSSVAPHVSAGLSGVVSRCLAKAPAERWQSSRELWSVLGPFEQTEGLPFTPYGRTIGSSSSASNPAPSFTPFPGATVKADTPPPGSAPTPEGSPTFSNQISGPVGSAHTIENSGWTAASVVDERPHSNMGGGGMAAYVGLGVALLVLGGGAVYAFSRSGSEGEAADEASAEAEAGFEVGATGGGTTMATAGDAASALLTGSTSVTGGTTTSAVAGTTSAAVVEDAAGEEDEGAPPQDPKPKEEETKPKTGGTKPKSGGTKPKSGGTKPKTGGTKPPPKEEPRVLRPSKPPRESKTTKLP